MVEESAQERVTRRQVLETSLMAPLSCCLRCLGDCVQLLLFAIDRSSSRSGAEEWHGWSSSKTTGSSWKSRSKSTSSGGDFSVESSPTNNLRRTVSLVNATHARRGRRSRDVSLGFLRRLRGAFMRCERLWRVVEEGLDAASGAVRLTEGGGAFSTSDVCKTDQTLNPRLLRRIIVRVLGSWILNLHTYSCLCLTFIIHDKTPNR